MVKRKLPKAELRRYIRDTPFTHDEVQKLWHRFTRMDADGTGQLNYQVRLSLLRPQAPLPSVVQLHLEQQVQCNNTAPCMHECST